MPFAALSSASPSFRNSAIRRGSASRARFRARQEIILCRFNSRLRRTFVCLLVRSVPFCLPMMVRIVRS